MNDTASLVLLFLIGVTAIYGGISAALLAALVAGAMYLLPKMLEDLKVPLFLLFLTIVGSALMPVIGGQILDSIAETLVYALDWFAGTLVEHSIVGAVAIIVLIVGAALLFKYLSSNKVRRGARKYWNRIKKDVRRFGR